MRSPPIEEQIFLESFLLLQDLSRPYVWFRAGEPAFNRWFARDAFKAGRQTLRLDSSPQCPLLAALRYGAKRQKKSGGKKGDIGHEDSEDLSKIPLALRIFLGKPPYYQAVDAAAQFVIGLSEYFEASSDIEALRELWPAAKLAVQRYLEDPSFLQYGFVAFPQKRLRDFFNLTHQNWRDGWRNHFKLRHPIIPLDVQCLLYAALKRMEVLAIVYMHEGAYGKKLAGIAQQLQQRIWEKFYWSGERYFHPYLQGEGREPFHAVLPEPAACVWTGVFAPKDDNILSRNFTDEIFARVMQDDIWTPFGPRSLSTEDHRWFVEVPKFRTGFGYGPIWPPTSWDIWKGARQYRRDGIAIKLEETMVKQYLAFRHEFVLRNVPPREMRKLFPEAIAVSKDKPHKLSLIRWSNTKQAWTAGAFLDMMYDRVSPELRKLRFRE